MSAIDGATVLVTGATDGHGRGVAAELARRGAGVLVHGRDRARAEATPPAAPSRTAWTRPCGSSRSPSSTSPGRYFEGAREAAADPFAYDAEARRRLWEASERLTGRA